MPLNINEQFGNDPLKDLCFDGLADVKTDENTPTELCLLLPANILRPTTVQLSYNPEGLVTGPGTLTVTGRDCERFTVTPVATPDYTGDRSVTVTAYVPGHGTISGMVHVCDAQTPPEDLDCCEQTLQQVTNIAAAIGGGTDYTAQLQQIIDRLAGDKDGERTLMIDDSGAVFYRIDEFDQDITDDWLPPRFEDLAGTPYTPGTNARPYAGSADPAQLQGLQELLAQLQALSGEDGTGTTTSTTDVLAALQSLIANLGGAGLTPNIAQLLQALEDTADESDARLETLVDATDGVEALLQDILNQLQQERDFEESLLCDDSGTVFYRVREYDAGTQTFLPPRFEDLAGAAYTPVGTPKPCSTADNELVQDCWEAIADGTGYVIGDKLRQTEFVDSDTGAIILELWKNTTQNAWLPVGSDPLIADLQHCAPAIDYDRVETCWTATADGTGYAEGERLLQVEYVDPATTNVLTTGWKNQTQDTWLTATVPLGDRALCEEPTLIEVRDCYKATADGGDYAVGDKLAKIELVDAESQAIAHTVWRKAETGEIISAPDPTEVTIVPCQSPPAQIIWGTIVEPSGSMAAGYQSCVQKLDFPLVLQEVQFDSVTVLSGNDVSATNPPENVLDPATNQIGVFSIPGRMDLELAFATPQDGITEIQIRNNGGTTWANDDLKSANLEILDSSGAVLHQEFITFASLPSSTGNGPAPLDIFRFGSLDDVATVRLLDIDADGGNLGGGGGIANNNVDITYIGALQGTRPPQADCEAVTVCTLYNENGTKNTTGRFSILPATLVQDSFGVPQGGLLPIP